MFQAKWFRAVLVMAVLASMIVAPLVVSAAETNGITAPADGATVSGEITVTGYAAGDDFKKWDLYLLPGGDDGAKAWLATGDTAGAISVPSGHGQVPGWRSRAEPARRAQRQQLHRISQQGDVCQRRGPGSG